MSVTPTRYRSPDEDSARWSGFEFRQGDIVISTRSKTGTTWVQMICALLVFQTPDLPAPLSELSPWLDWLISPVEKVFAQLDAQDHRRFVKTHTPLDGIPIDPHATYIVTGRHPLDMAVSLYHQGQNIDRKRLRELTGQPEPDSPTASPPALHDWLCRWIEAEQNPREHLDSLPGLMWHLSDAWDRRRDRNVVLVHYDDLSNDLEGQMRRLADLLGISVSEGRWSDLVRAATFEQMRRRPAETIPDPSGVLKDGAMFFRRGKSGAGKEALTGPEYDSYVVRARQLAQSDLLAWLHH